MVDPNKSLISWACASSLLLFACSADETGDSRPVQGASGSGAASGQLAPGSAGTAGGSVGSGLAGSGIAGTSATTGVAGSGVPGAAGSMGPLAGAMAAGSGAPMGGTRPPRGGAAGAAPPPVTVTNPAMCPAAPMDATPAAVQALAAVNTVRVASGAGCVNLVTTISNGATAHCNYYAMYMKGDMCIADPHGEVMTCMGFTGASPGARSKAAGYTLGGGGEVMAFFNNPQSAVDIWINSVWHRTPLLDPSTGDLGYGAAAGCDVIDFGRGVTAAASTVVVYPYDGQTNVPPSFNGANEGPMPPAPTSGWPSSSPVSVHAKGLVVTEHTITLDGDTTPIEHVWLDANATIVEMNMRRQLTNVNFMYANTPFAANTKYRVKLVGTITGGTLMKEWTFTTGAARRF
jgi:uncharacterized protein YkwD